MNEYVSVARFVESQGKIIVATFGDDDENPIAANDITVDCIASVAHMSENCTDSQIIVERGNGEKLLLTVSKMTNH